MSTESRSKVLADARAAAVKPTPARERLALLFDGDSFVELDTFAKVDLCVNIDVDKSLLMDRICGRRMCSCGATYHVSTLGGATTCAKCGKPLYRRDDDNPETVEARLNTYAAQTAPLVDYYAAQGKLCTVNGGAGSPEQVFAAIAAELDKYVK